MQLYCLYCTDEGHCIVTETFDTNLNLVVIRLVRERNKSHMDIPNHTGLYKKKKDCVHSFAQLIMAITNLAGNLVWEQQHIQDEHEIDC